MKDIISQRIAKTLRSPLFIFSVGVMVLNDHLLKGSGLIPSQITGKLSDFAFLFFLPIAVAYLFRTKTIQGLIACYIAVGASFAAINLSVYFSRAIESLFEYASIPLVLWPDSTDLMALSIIPLSLFFVLRDNKTRFQSSRILEFSLIAFCLLTCVATSPGYRYRSTHEPIYMSWEELRASVTVLPPREIMKRGKIYIKDAYLYVNEPNKGIHIFDNSDPKKPIPKCFLNIPGNIDLSIKGSYLYADSFTDLLVFALTIYPEDITLVNRVKDVFPYNPYQTRPEFNGDDANHPFFFHPTPIFKFKGAVVGWRRIQGM